MQTATSSVSTSRSLHSLETLAARSRDELDALYRAAAAPASMYAIDGPLVGRMLVVRGVPPLFAKPLRRWAGSPSFIWEGKTFQAASDTEGVGHNRVSIPGALGRQNLFPFATRFEPSSLDGNSSLILDYDLDVNPRYIRGIHDEIREVSPGLFLGPAMWKRADQRTFLLWFALDAGQA